MELKVNYEAELRAKDMRKLYDQIKEHIERANATYKERANKSYAQLEFKPRDLH